MRQHFNGQNTNDQGLSKVYNLKQPRKDVHTNNNTYHYGISHKHDGAQGDPKKWEMPGWRIEQDYSKRTLIGNWCEERNTVEHNDVKYNSTNRSDFTDNVKKVIPCTQERRHALRRNDGSSDKYLVKIGGIHKTGVDNKGYISWYDCDYRRTENKARRKWNRHKLVWEPEWSDRPLQGSSTQLGIRQAKFTKWKEDNAISNGSNGYNPKTTYSDFKAFSADAFPIRYAQSSKKLSSKLNTISRTNKSLPLRGLPLLCPPERQPDIEA